MHCYLQELACDGDYSHQLCPIRYWSSCSVGESHVAWWSGPVVKLHVVRDFRELCVKPFLRSWTYPTELPFP